MKTLWTIETKPVQNNTRIITSISGPTTAPGNRIVIEKRDNGKSRLYYKIRYTNWRHFETGQTLDETSYHLLGSVIIGADVLARKKYDITPLRAAILNEEPTIRTDRHRRKTLDQIHEDHEKFIRSIEAYKIKRMTKRDLMKSKAA